MWFARDLQRLLILATLFTLVLCSSSCIEEGSARELSHPGVKRITALNVALKEADWSPDSQRIAAIREKGREPIDDLVLIELGTRELTVVTNPEGGHYNAWPSWSADGTQLVFSSNDFGAYGVGIMDVDTKDFEHLGDDYIADWGPDSDRIAIGGPSPWAMLRHAPEDKTFYLRVLDLRTGEERVIFSVTSEHIFVSGMDWGPSQEYIALSFQAIDDLTEDSDTNYDIHLVAVDGSGTVPLFTSQEDEESPAWSPDGRLLAFVKGSGFSERSLWVSNADGSCPVQLIDQGNIDSPTWSPDGNQLAFTYYYVLYVLDLTVEPFAQQLRGLACQ